MGKGVTLSSKIINTLFTIFAVTTRMMSALRWPSSLDWMFVQCLFYVYRDRKDRMVLCGVHRPITFMNIKASRMGFEPRSY